MTKSKILKQIRAFCLECMGGNLLEIRDCTSKECQLYDFRQGKDPQPSKSRGFKAKSSVQREV